MKKLSVAMETMIREAAYHEVRVNGETVRVGHIVAGKANTVVALIDRGLATTGDAENFSLSWLTDGPEGGEAVRAQLLAAMKADHLANNTPLTGLAGQIIEDELNAEALTSQSLPVVEIVPITTTTEDSLSLLVAVREAGFHGGDDESTNEFPGDAERAFQTDEDAATYAEILAEQAVEVDAEFGVSRDAWWAYHSPCDTLITEGRSTRGEAATIVAEHVCDPAMLAACQGGMPVVKVNPMIRTNRGIFVSQLNYINVMRRVRDYRAGKHAAWLEVQEIITAMVNADQRDAFSVIDSQMRDGIVSFKSAERQKRIMRQIIRPTVGAKRKPSKHGR